MGSPWGSGGVFIQLPLADVLQLFVQGQIALVAAGGNLAGGKGSQHGAALFLGVAAAHKAAVIQIGQKLPEGLRQTALQLQTQLLRLKGGETRSVNDLRAAGEAEQLYVASGMAATAQRVTDLPYL